MIHLTSVDTFGKQGVRSRDIAPEEVGIPTSVSVVVHFFTSCLKQKEILTARVR